MPRTIETVVYKFDELNDRAKETARDWYRQHALDYVWWDCTYATAADFGLKITSFDTNRSEITSKFNGNVSEICQSIIEEVGKDTDLYKLADDYQERINEAITACHMKDVDEDFDLDSAIEDAMSQIKRDFKFDLEEEFLSILKKEEEYILSDEQVDESILANEYEFTAEGKRA
jgi:hypothetical protein